jgi:hypothetical protein
VAGNSVLAELADISLWKDVLGQYERRQLWNQKKVKGYRDIIESGRAVQLGTEVLAMDYTLPPAHQHMLNKLGSKKKKTIYTYPLEDELLLKGVNRILQKRFAGLISPLCHSFQPYRGARTAFGSLLEDRSIGSKHCLKLDIHNYFNSVKPDSFFRELPDEIRMDKPLFNLLRQMLLSTKVIFKNELTEAEQKGLMAGTPLAPLLSNLYLKPLDDVFMKEGITYARYSDDIILFSGEENIQRYESFIRSYLAERELQINEEKTRIYPPMHPWEYLGLKYDNGTMDLSDIAVSKLKGKVSRLAEWINRFRSVRSIPEDKAAGLFVRKLNKKLYGANMDDSEFCWAQWFFPMINTCESLKAIDKFVQDKMRYAVTGRYSKMNFRAMPYDRLKSLGYVPLVTAYYKFKKSMEEYNKLLEKRI